MKRIGLILALAAIVGCGRSDSFMPRLRAASTVGRWTGHVADATGCWPAFDIQFEITREEAANLNSSVDYYTTASGQWYVGETGPLVFTGTVRLDGGTSTLIFWKDEPVAGGSVRAIVARDGLHMNGTFSDQAHAFSLNSDCSASFTASK